MTLTCKTQLHPQKLDVPLQFSFFKDGSALGLSWNNSSELQVTALKRKNSGSYWCEAQAEGLKAIRSKRIQIDVRGECHWVLCWVLGGREPGLCSLFCSAPELLSLGESLGVLPSPCCSHSSEQKNI